MKKLYILLFFPIMVFSQVGINTTTPNAQLEIQSSNQAAPANTDGLLIPKINTFPATNPSAAQQGMLVYLTEAIGSNTPGFYYWDNLSVSWISIGDTINSSGWKLNGNSISGTDFLGTTNNQDLNFKRDNIEAGFIGASQTALGIEALISLTSGGGNNAFGLNALRNNSSGSSNNAFGNDALSLNTTGSFNSAFGNFSLKNNSASNNTAFGNVTLTNNTTGTENTAIGDSALATNNIGSNNVAVGFESQLTTTSGISNTAVGHSSMNNNTTGAFNTAVGTESLTGNSTGLFNNAFGYQANVNSGNLMNATAIGAQALVASNNAMVLGSIQGVNGAFSSVNVGIGTTTPQDRLHVEGNIRMVDGNEAMGRVLTSDANGTASWSDFTNLASGTLDQAYDFGGAGNGRTITADTGAVLIDGSDGLVSTGTLNTGAIAPSGSGTRMIWNPRKAAFRAGRVTFDQWDDANIGENSAAFGVNARASGLNSFAAGSNTSASGQNSTSFGIFTSANGHNSFSCGLSTNANGIYSVVFGESSNVNGTASFSMGRFNSAVGEYSGTLGLQNSSSSFGELVVGLGATTYTPSTNGATQFSTTNATDRLFVIGNAIDANNNGFIDLSERSDAVMVLKNGLTRLPSTTNTMIDAADGKAIVTKEYLQTNASGTLDQAYDFGGAGNGKTITADTGAVLINGTDGLVSTGTLGSGAVAPSGSGTRMVWNPRKAAFRAGTVTVGGSFVWDDASIGIGSAALGHRTLASGQYSTAFGDMAEATGYASTSFGGQNIASGNYSTAIGLGNIASGELSVAFGNGALASGIRSTAFGTSNTASGFSSTAFGQGNEARSYSETVIGIGATTYTPSTNGDTQFRTANATDRLFVIGNAIDANNNGTVDTAERSDAMVVLKNGNTGIGTSTPSSKLHVRFNSTINSINPTLTLDANQSGTAANITFRNSITTNSTSMGMLANGDFGIHQGCNFGGCITGTEVLRIKPNGNIGIGTTNALDKLHVVGNIRMVDGNQAAGKVLTSDANGTATWQDASANAWRLTGNGGTDSTTNFVGTTDNSDLNFRTNNVQQALFTASGKSIFGNSVPSSDTWAGFSKIVVGTNDADNDFTFRSSGSDIPAFNFLRSNGTMNSPTVFDSGELGSIRFWRYSGTGPFDGYIPAGRIVSSVSSTGASSLILSGSQASHVFISQTGNVGIGTNSPLERLHIAGKSLFENGFSTDNAALLYKNDTDYMFIGPQSGSTSNGGGLALFGSTNNTSGNPGGMDINVPTGSVRLFHSNGSYTFSTSSTSNYSGLFELNDIGFDIGHNSNSRAIIFSPGSTERMRLTPGGFLGVGTTAPSRRLHVSNGVSGGTSNGNTGILLESSGNVYQHFLTPSTSENGLLFGSELASINGGIIFNNSAVANGIQFRTGGNSNRMTITSAGNVGIGTTAPAGQLQLSTDDARKPGTNTWTITSDARLKNIKGNYTSGLNEILQLHPVRYEYRNNGERKFEEEVLNTEYSGFIAQEVQPLFPEAVGTDEDGFLNFNMHPILIASVNAFKELNTKYEELKTENDDLKDKLQALMKRIEALEKN